MNFSNRCFSFYRATGELISSAVYLRDDNYIDGVYSQNEKKWKFENSHLQFTDIDGNVTTEFRTKIDNNKQLIFLGKFFEHDQDVWHILAENPWEYRQDNTHITNVIDTTYALLRQMNDTLGGF
ncbi:hypothetical protein [Acetobacter sp.]|uniref:hypothetical protein n=1 Tax=Acetobacter sp. TaxID=440 RepID=UPI0025BD80A0|nr:hypothetical protein [Acetobacter sp.]MCH4090570.1 hypothetical protein [Acetobacter sp.]MCI1300013.1 hypothetical protein [Acetobacter sp.]MCI1316431.1 hypothetical protein [Acetobacter sp.]